MKKILIVIAAAAVLLPGGAWAGKHHQMTDVERENCLMTDNRGPNHDGAEFCIKSDKGMSQSFNVTSEQYSRVLQLMKAKGLFDSYSHSCEVQSDGTGYRCEDHLDNIAVVYYADNETTKINSVTIGSPPENTDHAAAIAAVAALSLNTKYVSLPTASPKGTSMFRALQSEIQRNMERIFIRGGSDASMTNEAMFMYFLNTKKDMSLVHVTRRAPL